MEESSEDRIQRALNESRKRELQEKYGADFPEGESRISPGLEDQFLRHVEEFEQQYQHASRVTVRQFVGNPSFKPIREIPAGQLDEAVRSVRAHLAEHHVVVDFLCEVPAEEQYRFITEELLEEDTDDIRMEGCNHHFIYEEFHPNDRYDATMYAEDFLRFLLNGDVKFVMNAVCKDELRDPAGARTTPSVMEESIMEFTGKVMTFIDRDLEVVNCVVDGDHAVVDFNVRWDGLMAESLARKTFSGLARINLKRSPYEGWDIVQAAVPGWNT